MLPVSKFMVCLIKSDLFKIPRIEYIKIIAYCLVLKYTKQIRNIFQDPNR